MWLIFVSTWLREDTDFAEAQNVIAISGDIAITTIDNKPWSCCETTEGKTIARHIGKDAKVQRCKECNLDGSNLFSRLSV